MSSEDIDLLIAMTALRTLGVVPAFYGDAVCTSALRLARILRPLHVFRFFADPQYSAQYRNRRRIGKDSRIRVATRRTLGAIQHKRIVDHPLLAKTLSNRCACVTVMLSSSVTRFKLREGAKP